MILRILDHTGDTEVDVEQDYDLAQELFTAAMANGKMAYYIAGPTQEIVHKLTDVPETATDVIVRTNYVGG